MDTDFALEETKMPTRYAHSERLDEIVEEVLDGLPEQVATFAVRNCRLLPVSEEEPIWALDWAASGLEDRPDGLEPFFIPLLEARSDDELRASIALHFVRAWITTCPAEVNDGDPDDAHAMLAEWARDRASSENEVDPDRRGDADLPALVSASPSR